MGIFSKFGGDFQPEPSGNTGEDFQKKKDIVIMATTPVVKQRINNPCYNQKMFSLSDDRFEGTTKVVNVFRAFTIEHLEKEPLFQTFIFFILNKNYQTKYDFKNWIFSFTFFPLILNLDILKYHNLKSFFSKFVRLSVIFV